MKKIIFFFLITVASSGLCAGFSLLPDNYSKMPTQEAIDILQQKQIEKPEDPIVNYNLGVALYKQGKYSQANTNFDRAVTHSLTPELRKKALFNQGNCFYSNTLDMLGQDWENKDLDQKLLEQASTQINGAIDKFKRALGFDKNNERIQNNLKVSEELAKKLQKKKQQEQQKQDKKDQEKKDQKQDEQDKQKQDQDKNKQEKQDQKDQDKQNQDKDKQEQEKQKQDQDKNKQEKQDQKDQDEQKQDQAQKQNQDKQDKDKQEQKKPESLKTKNMRARLENLQQTENNAQKKLMQMQSAQQQPQQSRGQKPW